MTRQIQLTRIHAINWYGYEDSLPLTGNVLLAGVTGSGKSVLMDLIQVVLLGPGGARYNLAASSDKSRKSGRTLKGYCLGDTKEEEDGVEQYMRDSGVTLIALEFTWPGGARTETWGFRIEYGSSSDVQPREQTPFVIPAKVERAAWLDDRRKPLTLAAFKGSVDALKGKCFDTVEEYRETIAGPYRLNFDRNVLDRLLPMAMSFTVRDSFDVFCRNHILPSEPVKVDNVISSFRIFQQYERELQELKNQLEHLNKISALSEKHTARVRDAIIFEHLAQEFVLKDAQSERVAKEQALEQLKIALKRESERIEQLKQQIQELDQKRDRLRLLVNAAPDGALCLHLRGQKQDIEERLRQISDDSVLTLSGLQERLLGARSWNDSARALDLDTPLDLFSRLDAELADTERAGLGEAETSLAEVKARADELLHALTRAAEPRLRRLNEVRGELELLRIGIKRLKQGWMPFRTPLLETLCNRLPSHSDRAAPRHLRELCEVTDETWRPALEIFFAEKFAVLVPSADYPLAEQVFRQLQASDLTEHTGRESLVRRDRVLSRDPGCHPTSLAAKLSCDDPQVRVLLNQMLGDVICVDNPHDLRLHERAILPDGFTVDGSLAERRRFYDGDPYIGKDGIRRQLAAKEEREQKFRTEELRDAPLEESLRALQRRHATSFGIDAALLKQCRAAAKRNELTLSCARLIVDLERILTQLPKGLLEELEDTDKQLGSAREAMLKQTRESRAAQLPLAIDAVEKAQGVEGKAHAELLGLRQNFDILPHLSCLQDWRVEIEQTFPSFSMASSECKSRHRSALEAASGLREDLVVARQRLASEHTRYRELDPQAGTNAEFDVHRKRIAGAEIDEYKEKATQQQLNWEKLFREQVLKKMRAALLLVDDLLNVITGFLRRPIGNSQYRIHWRDNPDFDIYHQLLDMSSVAKPGELFFAYADQKLKDAVAEFFRVLLDAPDGKEAQRLLDYRNYYRYEMTEQSTQPGSRPINVDRQADKFSGGENQTPYFIAILASYLRAYRRHGKRKEPSLALVPIDEAFSKLSGERIQDCINALRSQDLQGVFSMSTGNIPYAYSLCEQLIVITKKESAERGRMRVRNQPVNMLRGSKEEIAWLKRSGILEVE